MHTALGAVHAAALGAVAVVEQLTGEAGQRGAGLGAEDKLRDSGAVLPEVNHQVLSRAYHYLTAFLVGAQFDHLAVSLVGLAAHVLPHICLYGSEGQVEAPVYLGAVRRQYLALEFRVLLRRGEVGGLVSWFHAGVVNLAVEDIRMLHGASDAGFPVLLVGADDLLRAVGVGDLHHAAEGALLADHAVVSARGDNLVGPPARRYLYGKLVGGAGLLVDGIAYIVGE